MTMRDIPRAEWDGFFDTFTRQHRRKPVTVAKSDVRDGLRIAERATPLLDLTHDEASHRISITVEEPPSGEVTHTVVEPESVAVEEPAEADEDPQVVVHLTGGGQHFVVRLSNESRCTRSVETSTSGERPAPSGLSPTPSGVSRRRERAPPR